MNDGLPPVDAECIRTLYETYIETAEAAEKARKPAEGLLGFRGGPADDPCHDRFVEELAEAIGAYAARKPASAELIETLSYMFTVSEAHHEPRSAYWILIAVQGLSLKLIGGLDPADAEALLKSYKKTYPRWERLPVQNRVLNALKAQSRERA